MADKPSPTPAPGSRVVLLQTVPVLLGSIVRSLTSGSDSVNSWGWSEP